MQCRVDGQKRHLPQKRPSRAKSPVIFAGAQWHRLNRPLKNSFDDRMLPCRLKPLLILRHLRRGWKPRPFKTEPQAEFFSSL
jgi:hypothetical protein